MPLPTGFPPTTALGLGVSTKGSAPLYSAASLLKSSPRSKSTLDVPFLSSLSTDSFTKGCYSSTTLNNTHVHKILHAPSLIHILDAALAHEVHELRRPLGRRNRGRIARDDTCNNAHGTLVAEWILALRQLHHGYAQRPHITLQLRLLVQHLRGHVLYRAGTVISL